MYNHIVHLKEETKDINVRVSLAYNAKGNPSIGIRKTSRYVQVGHSVVPVGMINSSDSVIIGGEVWLIAGDLYNTLVNEEIESLSLVRDTDLDKMVLNLHGQATVAGSIVTVDLGRYNILHRYVEEHDDGLYDVILRVSRR